MNNKVTLLWVPGHCGILGNEKADQLAREGSLRSFNGPEPFCGVASSALALELKQWNNKTIKQNFSSATGMTISKKFITPNSRITNLSLNLNKKDLCIFTGLITGHCTSNSHLNKLNLTECNLCRLYRDEIETSEHILCHCAALFNKRAPFFEKRILPPSEIWECINPKTVVARFVLVQTFREQKRVILRFLS